jgi:peptidoglycan hydrolase CwlO-like protein
MKKKTMVGIALAMGMLSVGAISASAASSCCNDGKCTDRQVVEKVVQETAGTARLLNAMEIQLRELYGYEGFDNQKAAELESEIEGLKSKIKVVEQRYGISSCCRS